MINEERIMTMAKLEMFEKGKKKADLKISNYFKFDYISLQVIITLIWFAILYVIAYVAYLLYKLDDILADFSIEAIIELGVTGLSGLGVVLVFGGILSGMYFNEKYIDAKHDSKPYYRELKKLAQLYEKENENG